MAPPSQISAVWHALERRVASVETRLHLVENRQLRFMQLWIRMQLRPTSPTSTPTGQTAPTSTATSIRSRSPVSASRWRRLPSWLPKLLGWVADKLFQYLWPVLVGAGISAWALIKHYGEQLLAWAADWWHWLGF